MIESHEAGLGLAAWIARSRLCIGLNQWIGSVKTSGLSHFARENWFGSLLFPELARQAPLEGVPRGPIEDFITNLRAFMQYAKERDIILVLVGEPVFVQLVTENAPENQYIKTLHALADEDSGDNVWMVETAPGFLRHLSDTLLVDEVHETRRGNEVISPESWLRSFGSLWKCVRPKHLSVN